MHFKFFGKSGIDSPIFTYSRPPASPPEPKPGRLPKEKQPELGPGERGIGEEGGCKFLTSWGGVQIFDVMTSGMINYPMHHRFSNELDWG